MNRRYRRELFPITIFQSSVEDNERLKSILIPEIESSKRSLKDSPPGWLTNKIITSFENDEINEPFVKGDLGSEMRRQYLKVINSFFDDDWEIMITNLWYNYYINGEYQEGHEHVLPALNDIHFSCVHFLSHNDELHSPLAFSDPLKTIRGLSLEMNSNAYSERYVFTPREGDFIMFPSYLSHEVKAGSPTPEYPRITISFNIKVLKYGNE